jgi:hypothetical protein
VFKVALKHLPGAGGTHAKFAAGVDIQAVVAQALRAEGAFFKANPSIPGTFRVVADLGMVIGSKGETAIRVIVKYPGRVITAFPVRGP